MSIDKVFVKHPTKFQKDRTTHSRETSKEREALRFCVSHCYENVGDFDKFKTISHFSGEGIPKRTLHNISEAYDERRAQKFKNPAPPTLV